MGKILTEVIGTFFLVLVIALTKNPLYIGIILMVMVYMGGHVSGAHYNPAVTLAIRLYGKMSWAHAAKFWAAQLVGAILAALVAQALTGTFTRPVPIAEQPIAHAWVIEILFTFALALVVLNTGISPRTKGNQFCGVAIGLTVAAAAAAGGGISGGAFNPAVGWGMNLVALLEKGAKFDPSLFALYLVAPMVGAALAVPVFAMQERAQ